MYLHTIDIQNICSVRNFNMTFRPDEYAGWHVVIGDNGSGKSTLVRAIALILSGPGEAMALRQNWANWLRDKTRTGTITVHIDNDPKYDEITGTAGPPLIKDIPVILAFQRLTGEREHVEISTIIRNNIDLKNYLWGDGSGWFSASYGPFRRFTGGNRDYDNLFHSFPRLAPHLSVFGEDIALTECLNWFQTLYVRQLEGRDEGKQLDYLKKFVNEGGLLPHNTILEKVTSDGVIFRDGNGCEVVVEKLSDGYRSILSITFELIRQMIRSYGSDKVLSGIRNGQMEITLPGVVLIDEIDAHLHPGWQRQVGHWFRKYFPKIQFIVTTHSPLICHASEAGTVWKLPVSGDDFPSGQVRGMERKRLIYGSILEAYDTELFGHDVTRSDASKEKLKRLAILNFKFLQGKLSYEEEKELNELRAVLPIIENIP